MKRSGKGVRKDARGAAAAEEEEEESEKERGHEEGSFFSSASARRRLSSARLGSPRVVARGGRVNLSKFVPIRFMSATPRDATRYHAYTMPLPIVLPRIPFHREAVSSTIRLETSEDA